jgi:hypothetical protein
MFTVALTKFLLRLPLTRPAAPSNKTQTTTVHTLFNNFSPWSCNHGGTVVRWLVPNGLDRRARGRPPKIDARTNLGLTLVWTSTKGAEKTLQVIFGLTGTPLSKWVNFGHRVLTKLIRFFQNDQRIEKTRNHCLWTEILNVYGYIDKISFATPSNKSRGSIQQDPNNCSHLVQQFLTLLVM